MTDTRPTTDPSAATTAEPRLLRINEVAAEIGLTTRAIRYYEEMGLLEPAARSDGDYRLYDPSDLERLRFIKSLRDDAGFSLAQIGQLLEDEAARERNRERLRQTTDPAERRRYYEEARARVERQIDAARGQGRPPRRDDRRRPGRRQAPHRRRTSPSSSRRDRRRPGPPRSGARR